MKTIKIMGAGISGLSAGINLANAGYMVDIFEKKEDCGTRFHNDLEGLENWSSKTDILQEIKSMNLKINFQCDPFYSFCISDGKEILKNKFNRPLFYIVKRGTSQINLDQGLKKQALDLGINIHFNNNPKKEDMDIISTGIAENKNIGIAKGIQFKTNSDDIAVVLINKEASNSGYSYLLITKGTGTMCSVNFYIGGINANNYFKKTYKIFSNLIDIDIKNKKEFGGVGCFLIKPRLIENGKIYTGEAAGLQDLLWGFGMRYAIISGYLAAKSIINNVSYKKLIKKNLSPRLKTSIVNRYLNEKSGDRINSYLMNRAKNNNNWDEILYQGYNPTIFSRLIYPIAKMKLGKQYHNFS